MAKHFGPVLPQTWADFADFLIWRYICVLVSYTVTWHDLMALMTTFSFWSFLPLLLGLMASLHVYPDKNAWWFHLHKLYYWRFSPSFKKNEFLTLSFIPRLPQAVCMPPKSGVHFPSSLIDISWYQWSKYTFLFKIHNWCIYELLLCLFGYKNLYNIHTASFLKS